MWFSVVCTITDNDTRHQNNKDEEIKSHIVTPCFSSWRRALREGMNFKALLDYGHGLEMSEKQARAIKEQKKLAQVAEVQTVN